MPQRMPAVSVVIPLYNKGELILSTLSSVANQVDADFEIIVIDDGSTDDGATLLNKLDLPQLRLIEQQNRGVSAARNRGIAAARAEWIAFLDADDLWSRDHLAGLLRAVEGTDAIAAFSNVRLQSRGGQPLIASDVAPQTIDDYFSFALRNGGYPISSSSILVLKEQIVAAGSFAEGISIGEDIDMWCRLACRGRFVYTASMSATYNDARSPTLVSGRGEVVRPLFARRLPELMQDGRLPSRLLESSKRYANFLLLEYARQLLDTDEFVKARSVLLNECVPSYDWRRFLKRLSRTTPVGKFLFHMIQPASKVL